ncbi:MAG: hypothetical protein H6Q73_4489 [Firmicutes bacterium]|nr:hypothetical protein [Bacillota bacterium]
MKKKLSALILGLMVMSFAATVSAHEGPCDTSPSPQRHYHNEQAPHRDDHNELAPNRDHHNEPNPHHPALDNQEHR